MTATTYDCSLPPWYTRVDRARFYDAACGAAERAMSLATGPRACRRAEREAILQTMETFGLIRRTRGGAPINPQQCERLT